MICCRPATTSDRSRPRAAVPSTAVSAASPVRLAEGRFDAVRSTRSSRSSSRFGRATFLWWMTTSSARARTISPCTKELFRAMIRANLGKKWIAQATINMADDEELLQLAAKAGCLGIFVGFESTSAEGLAEVHKKFNIQKGRDFPASVRRIQRHGMPVMGSFIIGLDVDKPGIGRHDSRDSQPLRRRLHQRAVSDAAARHPPVGPNGIRRAHRRQHLPGRLAVLHVDLPGGSVTSI